MQWPRADFTRTKNAPLGQAGRCLSLAHSLGEGSQTDPHGKCAEEELVDLNWIGWQGACQPIYERH